jgi:hypothetical protein
LNVEGKMYNDLPSTAVAPAKKKRRTA